MSNQSPRESGSQPGSQPVGRAVLRSHRKAGVGRGMIILWLVLVGWVSASTGLAAEIVEVRVGRHAEFTRVVFELDRAAGYRIERASPSPGVSELVVSLEATSIPRRIQSSRSLIEQVEVEPSGPRSVARVRLARGGLRLKEMILASPPRIVLDVLSDEPVAASTAAKTKEAAKSRGSSRTADAREISDSPDASASSTTGATAGSSAGTKATGSDSGSGTASASARASGTPGSQTASAAAARASAGGSRDAQDSARPQDRGTGTSDRIAAAELAVADETEESADTTDTTAAAAGERSQTGDSARVASSSESDPDADSESASGAMKILREREQALARAAREPSTSAPVETREDRPAAGPAKSGPRPMVARMPEEGSGWLTWTLAGGGAIALLLGGFLVWRSRQEGEEVDYEEDGEAPLDDAPIEFGRSPEQEDAENPFAGIMGGGDEDQMALGAPDETTMPPIGDETGGAPTGSAPEDEPRESTTFAFGAAEDGGDAEEKDMDDMEMISRDAVNEGLGGMPPAMGGMSEDVQQMMREMNRRVEALEGRIDELVDARDRLERQVAAQTEELRVQRAAIARTQRAVRNLARPEDEPEATEPALREPPSGGDI